ncbi:MAG: WbuC family cupin fold metalloprotein [Verrucomicrobiota bacterium]|jgi:cupin fold WbuC family metalloprotein|nr:WbuC family cupin fold metalloprotein [Verrucomicrobiota bacterium]
MPPSIRIIDDAFLDALAEEAAAAPRRRKNANLHQENTAVCHRLFNALQADTYIRPHRHDHAAKDETVVILRGKMGLVEFDEHGAVLSARLLHPGMSVDIPHGTFHGWCCMEDGTIFFEAKAGPYTAMTEAEWAAFAPPEGDPRAPDYLAELKTWCTRSTLSPPIPEENKP